MVVGSQSYIEFNILNGLRNNYDKVTSVLVFCVCRQVVTIKKRGRPSKQKSSTSSTNLNNSLTPIVSGERTLETAATENEKTQLVVEKFDEKKNSSRVL